MTITYHVSQMNSVLIAAADGWSTRGMFLLSH
jgi:hypothetical protein